MATSTTLAVGPLNSAGPVMVWVVVLTFLFLECAFVIGLFLPGDSLLFTAGVVLAGQGHEVSAWALAVVATVVAIGANQLGYHIGRGAGQRFVARRDGRVLNQRNLARARDFLDRRGFWAIVLARWIPWIRTLAPMVAGMSKMDARKFLGATSIGAVVWVPTLVLVGYYGAGLLDRLPWLKTAAVSLCVAFFVLGTGWGLVRYRQEMRHPVDRPRNP